MASISEYLAAIKNAIYGKEVRDAIYNAINTINEDLESYEDNRHGVRYDEDQTSILTDEQKAIARNNISATNDSDVVSIIKENRLEYSVSYRRLGGLTPQQEKVSGIKVTDHVVTFKYIDRLYVTPLNNNAFGYLIPITVDQSTGELSYSIQNAEALVLNTLDGTLVVRLLGNVASTDIILYAINPSNYSEYMPICYGPLYSWHVEQRIDEKIDLVELYNHLEFQDPERVSEIQQAIDGLNDDVSEIRDDIDALDNDKADKTWTVNRINEIANYSSSEALTGGTWTNGYPIIRAIFNVQSSATGNIEMGTLDPDSVLGAPSTILSIISIQGTIRKTSTALYHPIPLLFNSTSTSYSNYNVYPMCNISTGKVTVNAGSAQNVAKNLSVIVEYVAKITETQET